MPNLRVELVKGIFSGLPSYYEAASEVAAINRVRKYYGKELINA